MQAGTLFRIGGIGLPDFAVDAYVINSILPCWDRLVKGSRNLHI